MKSLRTLAAAAARRLFPLIPPRQKLGFEFWIGRIGGDCEPELEYLDEYVAGTRTAIDAGPIDGLFTYALSKRFRRVVALVGNETAAKAIQRYNPGHIEVFVGGAVPGGTTNRLDDLQITDVDFVRIANQSCELDVLEEAIETIARWRPMVLIELRRQSEKAADAWFRNLDYKRCRLEDFTDVRGEDTNSIFTPIEKLARFGMARPVA